MKLADLAKNIPFLDSLPPASQTLEIQGLTEDSRKAGPGILFAALPGVKADGMAYAAQAQAQGAAAILAGKDASAEGVTVPLLRTDNPRRAVALMAARFYGAQPAVAAAVTGTNGKTSVAAFVRQVWAATGHAAASLGTVGIVTPRGETPSSHTTPDPITLHKQLADLANEGVTHLAMEASSHGLAQYRLDGVKLSAGAFTNITRDHLDYHGTFEDYLAAKMRLFCELLAQDRPVVIDTDGPGHEDVVAVARTRKLQVLSVGRHGDFLRLKEAAQDGFKQRLSLEHAGKTASVLLPLAGDFQVSNALVAAGLAIGLGDAPESVFEALTSLRGAKGRLEFVGETFEAAPIFVDYAHTPDALAKALQALRPYVSGRLYVVFGCGGDRDKGKRPLMGAAASQFADVVIVTDDNPRSEEPAHIRRDILAGASQARDIGNRSQAITEAIATLKAGDVLVVAGKGHETGQIVGATVIPYSDHEAVAQALAHLRGKA